MENIHILLHAFECESESLGAVAHCFTHYNAWGYCHTYGNMDDGQKHAPLITVNCSEKCMLISDIILPQYSLSDKELTIDTRSVHDNPNAVYQKEEMNKR